MNRIIVFFLLGIALPGALFAQQLSRAEREAIMEVFAMQEKAWNEGDIDAFMEGYLKSDELVFVGASGPKYGWQTTKDNYHARYPDRTAMGKLKFDILRMNKIDKKTAFVIGKFYLTRTIGDLSGYFTLVWKKIGGKWVIISDHTSSEG
ncbi:MAG: nuclear transport factor 2 family protein [Bacteroidetes bacterium]|nr:MAG: nuclear transport factor 2 family protein [Bacteroidota bacterium]